jgi:hypothetical protein
MKMYTDHCLGLVLIQGIIVFWVLFCFDLFSMTDPYRWTTYSSPPR